MRAYRVTLTVYTDDATPEMVRDGMAGNTMPPPGEIEIIEVHEVVETTDQYKV